jgi:phage I-like protein
MPKQIKDINKSCSFALKLSNENIDDNNMSGEFVILEHLEDDQHEYKNGMLSFTLNKKKIDQLASSFSQRPRELYINYDHESDGKTLAAGWFRDVRAGKTENGYGLFAKAEWSPVAAKHIKEKEYMYFSVECEIEGMVAKWGNEVIHDPKFKKSTLTGGALTNDPYFTTTNLSLSKLKNNTEEEMSETLKAEFDQYRAEKSSEILVLNKEIAKFKADFEAKESEVLKLSNELSDLKKSNKDAMIASFCNRLPDDKEKRDLVKVKLEKFADKLDSAEFNEMAELIIAQHDKRINPAKKIDDAQFKNVKEVELSVEEITEIALKDLNSKMGGSK